MEPVKQAEKERKRDNLLNKLAQLKWALEPRRGRLKGIEFNLKTAQEHLERDTKTLAAAQEKLKQLEQEAAKLKAFNFNFDLFPSSNVRFEYEQFSNAVNLYIRDFKAGIIRLHQSIEERKTNPNFPYLRDEAKQLRKECEKLESEIRKVESELKEA